MTKASEPTQCDECYYHQIRNIEKDDYEPLEMIEYSAFEQMRKECDFLRAKELAHLQLIGDMDDTNQKLKAKLEAAKAKNIGYLPLIDDLQNQLTAAREKLKEHEGLAAKLALAREVLTKIGNVDHPSIADKTSWIVMTESICSLAREALGEIGKHE